MLRKVKNVVWALHFCSALFTLMYIPAVGQQKIQLQQTALMIRSRPDSAYRDLQNLLSDAVEKNDALTEAVCHQQLGQILYNNGNYTQALDHLLKAEKMFRQRGQAERLAKNLNYLGYVYYDNKQPGLAARQFQEALAINEKLKDISGIALTYGNIGHAYEKKLLYDSAYYYQEKALGLYRQANDSMGMAKIFENMGSIYEDRQIFDSSRTCFERALLINQHFGDQIAQIEILNNLGDISRKTGDYNDGLFFTRKALHLAKKTHSQHQLASAYRDMARGFELMHSFDSAYYYNELSRELVEQIYSMSNNQQIALQETIYDVEKKNSEIAQLALDKKVNTVITICISVTIVLLVVLGAAIISRQRLKIKNEKSLNEQNHSNLVTKDKQLSAHMLHLIQKNQLLEELRGTLNEILKDDKRDQKKQLKQLVQKINVSFSQDAYWDEFRAVFEQLHESFFDKVRQLCSELSPNDLRLVALLKMNVSSSDIATLLGISLDSLRVTRYRLRKKLKLEQGESLTNFIQSL